MVLNLTVVKTPSVLAQQAGKTESIVVPPTAVTAQDERAAILKLGRDKAKELEDEADGSFRVLVQPLG